MLKEFQTKKNPSYPTIQRTPNFNQIYKKSTISFITLVRVFSGGFFHLIFRLSKRQSSDQSSALSIILTLFVAVILICSDMIKVSIKSVSFYPIRNALLFECLDFDLLYQYNLHYTQDSKIHKLQGISNNLEFFLQ